MTLKKKHILKNKDIIVIVIILNIIISLIFFVYFNKNAKYLVSAYAKSKITNIITNIINDSIKNETYESDKYYNLLLGSDNEILSIDYNNNIINKQLVNINSKIQENIKKTENNKELHFFKVPFGIISTNVILATLGPKIPVKIRLFGSTTSKIKTTIKEYGINNVLVEMYIEIEVKEVIFMPFLMDDVIVKTSIPISTKIISGKVPDAYGGLISNSSNIKSLQ